MATPSSVFGCIDWKNATYSGIISIYEKTDKLKGLSYNFVLGDYFSNSKMYSPSPLFFGYGDVNKYTGVISVFNKFSKEVV